MIISGYTDAEDIIQGINEAGIYQYVTKPWQPESLTLTSEKRRAALRVAAAKTSFWPSN